jgi:hypothetical protein
VTSLTIAGQPAARKEGGLAPSSHQAYKLTLLLPFVWLLLESKKKEQLPS